MKPNYTPAHYYGDIRRRENPVNMAFWRCLHVPLVMRDCIVRSIMDRALAGDSQIIKLMWNYLDGMPTQPVEHSGAVNIIVGVRLGPCNCSDPPKQPDIWLYVEEKTYEIDSLRGNALIGR